MFKNSQGKMSIAVAAMVYSFAMVLPIAYANTYERMSFGYNTCDVQWGALHSGVTEANMISLATQAGAKGFTYHSSLQYGKLLIGSYPLDCQSPANESWPLYLLASADSAPAVETNSYEKMSFGYNTCDVQWGTLQRGVTEANMISLATQAGAKGFTYHPSLKYGKLLIGKYPKKCQSPANQSWPLYLLVDAPKSTDKEEKAPKAKKR